MRVIFIMFMLFCAYGIPLSAQNSTQNNLRELDYGTRPHWFDQMVPGYQPLFDTMYQKNHNDGQIYHGVQMVWLNIMTNVNRSHLGDWGTTPTVTSPILISKIYIRAGDSIQASDFYNFTVKMRHIDSSELGRRYYHNNVSFGRNPFGIPLSPSLSFLAGLDTVFSTDVFPIPDRANVYGLFPNIITRLDTLPPYVVIELDTPFLYPGWGYGIAVEITHEGFSGTGFLIRKSIHGIGYSYQATSILYGNPPYGSSGIVTDTIGFHYLDYGFDTMRLLDAHLPRFLDVYDSLCSGMNAVRLEVRNAGLDSLHSLRIDWEVDGIAQTPYFYNKTLPSLHKDTIVLGYYNFPSVGNSNLKAWSSLPNNGVDDYVWNDTLIRRVTPNLLPLASLDLGNDHQFCLGDSVTLSNSTSGLSGFLWDDQSTNPSRTVYASGTYHVMARDANGCLSSDTVAVTVIPLPVVDLGNDRNICPRDSVLLTAGNSSSNAYLWDDQSTGMTRTVNYSGTYWVRVTGPEGCQNSDTIQVTSPGAPSGSISVYDRGGGRHDFSIMNAYNVNRYVWDFGDGSPQEIGSNVSHTYAVNGNYVVRATLEGLCPNQVRQLQQQLRVRTVGIDDVDNAFGIQVIPNPFSKSFSLQSDLPKNIRYQVRVTDIMGKVIFEELCNLEQVNQALQSESPDWNSGMYLIQVMDMTTKEQVMLRANKIN